MGTQGHGDRGLWGLGHYGDMGHRVMGTHSYGNAGTMGT